jgi:hypothetical protein
MNDPKDFEKWIREYQELLKTDPKKAREILDKQVEDLVKSHPVLIVTGLLVLQCLAGPVERPKWLKDCPPVGGRRNGAWRGKGSFGKGFGPNKVRHK